MKRFSAPHSHALPGYPDGSVCEHGEAPSTVSGGTAASPRNSLPRNQSELLCRSRMMKTQQMMMRRMGRSLMPRMTVQW